MVQPWICCFKCGIDRAVRKKKVEWYWLGTLERESRSGLGYNFFFWPWFPNCVLLSINSTSMHKCNTAGKKKGLLSKYWFRFLYHLISSALSFIDKLGKKGFFAWLPPWINILEIGIKDRTFKHQVFLFFFLLLLFFPCFFLSWFSLSAKSNESRTHSNDRGWTASIRCQKDRVLFNRSRLYVW